MFENVNSKIENSGIDSVIQNLRNDKGQLRDLIAAEILEGSNEKAAEILRLCGCKAIIPGTMYAPMHEVDRFYQCRPGYLTSILRRFGITVKFTPTEFVSTDFPTILRRNNVGADYIIGNDYITYTMIHKTTREKYEFSYVKGRYHFVSARVVLALSMLMYYGSNLNPDGVGKSVCDKLMTSTYAEAAKVFQSRRDDPVIFQPDGALPVVGSEQISTSAEQLSYIIKTSVASAMAEFAKYIEQGGFTPKLHNQRSA